MIRSCIVSERASGKRADSELMGWDLGQEGLWGYRSGRQVYFL